MLTSASIIVGIIGGLIGVLTTFLSILWGISRWMNRQEAKDHNLRDAHMQLLEKHLQLAKNFNVLAEEHYHMRNFLIKKEYLEQDFFDRRTHSPLLIDGFELQRIQDLLKASDSRLRGYNSKGAK